MLKLEATHSHLYPGARGRVLAGNASDRAVTLLFADGVRVAATLAGERLSVLAHETAKGTAIPAKSWIIDIAGDNFRIRGRAN